jgi:hypothetical protein
VTVQLTDPSFECSSVIRLILGILHGSHDLTSSPSFALYSMYDLASDFATKWDISLLRMVISSFLLAGCSPVRADQGYRISESFLIAAKHGNLDVCVQTLARSESQRWSDTNAGTLGVVVGYGVLDPKGWPLEFTIRVPGRYVWALNKVMEPFAEDNHHSRRGGYNLAIQFRSLVETGRISVATSKLVSGTRVYEQDSTS